MGRPRKPKVPKNQKRKRHTDDGQEGQARRSGSRKELNQDRKDNPEEYQPTYTKRRMANDLTGIQEFDPTRTVHQNTEEALAELQENNVGFATFVCRCPPERKAICTQDFIQTTHGGVAHRMCCCHMTDDGGVIEAGKGAFTTSYDRAAAALEELWLERMRVDEAITDHQDVIKEIELNGSAQAYEDKMREKYREILDAYEDHGKKLDHLQNVQREKAEKEEELERARKSRKTSLVLDLEQECDEIKERLDDAVDDYKEAELTRKVMDIFSDRGAYQKELIESITETDISKVRAKCSELKKKRAEMDFETIYDPIKKEPLECVRSYAKYAVTQESEVWNAHSLPEPITLASTNQHYISDVVKPFDEHVKRMAREEKRPMTVLSLYSGIGNDISTLKGIGIDMKKAIYVDHDKVAREVYKANHDYKYTCQLVEENDSGEKRKVYGDIEDDGIDHVYYERFEDIENDINSILNTHGPIDLVIAGPPCQDYSTVNARRQGSQGALGQYLPRTGAFIHQLMETQAETFGPDAKLYYLVENVPLSDGNPKDDINKGDLAIAKKSLGMKHEVHVIDSHWHAPCRRRRAWFTNIPLLVDMDPSEVLKVEDCLEAGWYVAGHIEYDPEDKNNIQCYGPTFMASKGRLADKARMYVFQDPDDEDWCKARPWKTSERERAMGFPAGYVEKPVDILFQMVTDAYNKRLLNIDKDEDGNYISIENPWKSSKLPFLELAKTFSNNFHKIPAPKGELAHGKPGLTVKFSIRNKEAAVKIEVAPPQVTEKPSYYNSTEYAQRLIGNSFCSYTLKRLLKPLDQLFARKAYDSRFSECWRASSADETTSRAETATVEDEVVRLQAELKMKFGERPENEIACSTGCGKIETRKGRDKFTCAECLARKENGQKKAAAPNETQTTSSNGRYQQTASPTCSSVSSSSPSLENENGIASNEANKPIAKPSVVRSQCHTEEI